MAARRRRQQRVPEPGLLSVVGGESTGKSSLVADLGIRLPAVVVSEFLRDWVDREGRVPMPDEQAAVMAAHRELELAALADADQAGLSWVASDSGPLMTAVYSVHYYRDASLLPRALEWTRRSNLVVWCQDDFPWQPDPQRDGSHARTATQAILAEVFAEHPELPVLAVAGTHDARLRAVLDAVGAVGSGSARL
jgi:nicotinamide riboside kinase